MEKGNLLAILAKPKPKSKSSDSKSDSKSSDKKERKLSRIASELIEAVGNQDEKSVAMALQDAVECINDGADAYNESDDSEDDYE